MHIKKIKNKIAFTLAVVLSVQAMSPMGVAIASNNVKDTTTEDIEIQSCPQEDCDGITCDYVTDQFSEEEMIVWQEEYDQVMATSVSQEILNADSIGLTSLALDYSKSFVEPGQGISINQNDMGNKISMNVSGEEKTFEYGISAWATSEIHYDISQYSSDFDYLTLYAGIDASHTTEYLNLGAYIYISTSVDGVNWDRQYTTSRIKSFDDATFVKIPIEGVNYIKLEGDKDGTGWWHHKYDEVCYGDPKLIKDSYEEPEFVDPQLITVAELDTKIRAYDISKTNTEEYQLLTMQRSLLANTGYNDLVSFLGVDSELKAAFDWLFYDYDNMKDYMLGGEPDGTYLDALFVWRDLFAEFYDDLYDTGSDERVQYSDLYRRMLFTISLTHSTRVGHWIYNKSYCEPGTPNTSYANDRYKIFKKLYHADLLDNTIFPFLEIEEMRFVMNNIIDDESIEWLNWYITKSAAEGISKYHHVAYLSGYNYADNQYYSAENYDKWDTKYNLSEFGITYDNRYTKNWVVYEEGAVCGGISKTGSNHEGVFGVPSSVVSQPGHAAYIDYRLNEDGDAYWTVLNNISGWQQSGRTEKLATRMPNGWGDGSYAANYPASYIFLAQDSMNNFNAYEESELILFQKETFANDPERLQDIYKEALYAYDKNFDAWLGLTNLYIDQSEKTDAELMELINSIGETLKYFPYPCHDLLALLETQISTPSNQGIYTFLVDGWLSAASTVTGEDSIQATQVNAIAKFLQGDVDGKIASFSFSGEDANKIVLDEKYHDSQVRWDYSLDCGESWNEVDGHEIELTNDELESITIENGVRVHIVGLNYSNENIVVIDITEGTIDSKVSSNDLENKIVGNTTYLEWRMTENEDWTKFSDKSPDLSGDCSVFVRSMRNGNSMSSESRIYNFTTNEAQDPERSYISIDDFELHAFSTEQAAANEHAANIIDANPNTMWHSSYSGDSERYITIELKTPVHLSAMEYQPRASGSNGRVLTAEVYISMDGVDYELATREEGWANNSTMKTIEFDKPVETKFIKFHAAEANGNFISGIALNYYEDTTVDTIAPTASIEYTYTEDTIIATLVEASEEITITNNEGSDTYVFTEDGEFTFEFEDLAGNKGEVTAIAKFNTPELEAPEVDEPEVEEPEVEEPEVEEPEVEEPEVEEPEVEEPEVEEPEVEEPEVEKPEVEEPEVEEPEVEEPEVEEPEVEEPQMDNKLEIDAETNEVTFSKVDGGSIKVRILADFKDFIEVRINGAILDREFYNVWEGSIIVELTEEYLSSLENGKYAFEVLASTGIAEFELEIKEESNVSTEDAEDKNTSTTKPSEEENQDSNVEAGDNTDIIIYIVMMICSIFGISSTYIKKRNRKSR